MAVNQEESHLNSRNFRDIFFELRFLRRHFRKGGLTPFQQFMIIASTLVTIIITILSTFIVPGYFKWGTGLIGFIGFFFSWRYSFKLARTIDVLNVDMQMTQWQFVRYWLRRKFKTGRYVNGHLHPDKFETTHIEVSASTNTSQTGGRIVRSIKQMLLSTKIKPIYRPFDRIDGAFIRDPDGNWIFCVSMPLEEGFDDRVESDAEKIKDRHLRLFLALKGWEATIEVLPIPITVREREERIMAEQTRTYGVRSEHHVWLRQVARMARILKKSEARPSGDWEPKGFMLINLGQEFPDYPGTISDFRLTLPEDKFYLQRPENAFLIEPARELISQLKQIWPGIAPADRVLHEKFILAATNPGHDNFANPDRVGGNVVGETDLLDYLCLTDYDDREPDYVRVICDGRVTYVACLPIRLPEFRRYIPNKGHEAGFTAFSGVRVRFTYRFKVVSGKDAIAEAGEKVEDVINHAASYGGNKAELAQNIQAAQEHFEHLYQGNPVVVGRPMLVIAADTPQQLSDMRHAIASELAEGGNRIIRNNYAQKDLLIAALPGASWLALHNDPVGPDLAAQTMPFVTTGIGMKGPDLWAFSLGKEILPVFHGLDAKLWEGNSGSPFWVFGGVSGYGKTTTLVDTVFAMSLRLHDSVSLLLDLEKNDLGRLDLSLVNPDLVIDTINLSEFPGCLNPVLLKVPDVNHPERFIIDRQLAMAEMLSSMCGQRWQSIWDAALGYACGEVLMNAFAEYPDTPRYEVIPDLYKVAEVIRHPSFREAHKEDMLVEIDKILAAPGAELACSNQQSHQFLDRFRIPGIHIAQWILKVPSKLSRPENYTPAQNVAVALLQRSTQYTKTINANREIITFTGLVEASRFLGLNFGADEADAGGRTGRALKDIMGVDTQLPEKDLPEEVASQVTGHLRSTPELDTDLERALISMGEIPTEQRLLNFTGLKDPGWSHNPKDVLINKGAVFAKLPRGTTPLIRLQFKKFHVMNSLVTDTRNVPVEAEVETAPKVFSFMEPSRPPAPVVLTKAPATPELEPGDTPLEITTGEDHQVLATAKR